MSIKLKRFTGNPILEPIDKRRHWWERGAVFNPGVVAGKDGKIYLLYRAMARIAVSSFGLAKLSDPFTLERRYKNPVFEGRAGSEYERFGVEDPRIVVINDKFNIVYVAVSLYTDRKPQKWSQTGTPWRTRVCLAQTEDFKNWKRKGVILSKYDSKDGTLFPEKINEKYVLLHRIFPDIWISFSDRIDRFGKGKILCRPRSGYWDNDRIGAGAQPIKTDIGWLLFYHGVTADQRKTKPERIYHLGILLLDPADPTKILYRSSEPILSPSRDYEQKGGLVSNVVFTCGAIDWKGKYCVYYGAADGKIGVASINKQSLLKYLARHV